MKTKLFSLIVLFVASQTGHALACSSCYGAIGGPRPPVMEHMAIAIWFLMGAIMTVLGGIGAFSFHLWRHAHMPLEPHQELAEEDFAKYD
jgi:uncharacterized BrkB/YihY/UPF0761 family membrane protein